LLPQIFAGTSLPELSYLALNSLKKVLAMRWNSFSAPAEKLSQYNFLVTAMLDRSSSLPPYIANTLAQVVSRYARMGWLEDEAYKGAVGMLIEAAFKDPYLCSLALNFFKELIAEVMEPIKSRPLSAHRKMAISFRDSALLEIFRFIHFLMIKGTDLAPPLRLTSLQVCAACLSYDFLGISADESAEDSVCVQIPLPWAPLIQDEVLLKAVEAFVMQTEGEELTAALRVLNHLGAVRRSLFGSKEVKATYLERYLKSTMTILNTKKFEVSDRFEVAHLLKRFVQNFQLREIGEIPGYEAWLQTLARYTAEAYSLEEAVESTYVSMMFLWSYLSYEANNQVTAIGKPISGLVNDLLKLYLNSMLTHLTAEHLQEQAITADNDLLDHLEHIANCCILHYDQIMPELYARLNELLEAFQRNLAGEDPRLDAQLAWLVYIVGALIGQRDKKSSKDSENLDNTAIQLVFHLVNLTDSRIQLSSRTSATMEAGLTYFFNCLRKAYINSPNELSWYFFEPETAPAINEERLNQALTSIVSKL
jgi:exportin-7